jgi:hypothetical protein
MRRVGTIFQRRAVEGTVRKVSKDGAIRRRHDRLLAVWSGGCPDSQINRYSQRYQGCLSRIPVHLVTVSPAKRCNEGGAPRMRQKAFLCAVMREGLVPEKIGGTCRLGTGAPDARREARLRGSTSNGEFLRPLFASLLRASSTSPLHSFDSRAKKSL